MRRGQCTTKSSNTLRTVLEHLMTLNYPYPWPVCGMRPPCSSKSTTHSPYRPPALKAIEAQASDKLEAYAIFALRLLTFLRTYQHLREGGAGRAGTLTAHGCLIRPPYPDAPVPGQEGCGCVDAAVVNAPADLLVRFVGPDFFAGPMLGLDRSSALLAETDVIVLSSSLQPGSSGFSQATGFPSSFCWSSLL